jgi:hypothetical protein
MDMGKICFWNFNLRDISETGRGSIFIYFTPFLWIITLYYVRVGLHAWFTSKLLLYRTVCFPDSRIHIRCTNLGE